MLLVVGSWVWVLDLIISCIDLGRLTLHECCITNVVFCEVEYRNSVCSMPLSMSSVTHGCLTAICRQYYKLAGRTYKLLLSWCTTACMVSTSVPRQPSHSSLWLRFPVSSPFRESTTSYHTLLSIRHVQPTGFPYCWPVRWCGTCYLTNSDIHHMDSSLGQPCSVSVNVTSALEVFFTGYALYIFIFYLFFLLTIQLWGSEHWYTSVQWMFWSDFLCT